jgi:hypothetical protein
MDSLQNMPQSASVATEAILAFDSVGGFAKHDAVCKEHNFTEGEITLLEPRTVPDGRGRIVLSPSRFPPTSPNKSVITV